MRSVRVKAGLVAPELRWDNGLWVAFAFAPESVARIEAATTEEITQEAVQTRLRAELRSEPSLTVNALAARVGLTADGVKYHLTKMKSAGVLRRVGSTKTGRWEVLPATNRASTFCEVHTQHPA